MRFPNNGDMIEMELSRITTKGQITLPASIRKRFGLSAGQTVMFDVTDAGIIVKPVHIEDLTRKAEWKKQLDAAVADAQAGRGTLYENEEEFLAALQNNFKKSGKKKSK